MPFSLVFIFLALIVGCCIGWFGARTYHRQVQDFQQENEELSSALLLLHRTQESSNKTLASLENSILDLANQQKEHAESVAQQFSSLTNKQASLHEVIDLIKADIQQISLQHSEEKQIGPLIQDTDATRVLSMAEDEAAAAFAQYQQLLNRNSATPLDFTIAPDWEATEDQDDEPAVLTERPYYLTKEEDSPFDYDSWNS